MAVREQILKIFPLEIRRVLERMPVDFEKVQELRLRTGRPLMILAGGREFAVTGEGKLWETDLGRCDSGPGSSFFIPGPAQMREMAEFMGSFSLYAAEEELRQGFLTVQGGHRIGVAGRTVVKDQDIRLMKSISFINVRVAHQVKGCADPVLRFLYDREGHFLNTLIISPPQSGKTTLLRDLIRQLSDGHALAEGNKWIPGMNVGVVDERSELGACYQGIPQNDLGMRTDVLDCCPKTQGMMMLVRSMSPKVIAVDEIGSAEDVNAMEYAGNCGCGMAATVHGFGVGEIAEKPAVGRLIKSSFFKRLIVLDGKREPGHVEGVYDEKGKRLWGG